MKKFFATAVMAMSVGCVFAQGNVNTNDSTANDSTKTKLEAMLLAVVNDSVAADSTKALAMLEDSVAGDSAKALVAQNDTVVTDSTKARPAALVARAEVNDTVATEKKDAESPPRALAAKKQERKQFKHSTQ